MGKNWLRSAMTVGSDTFGVQPGKRLEMDPAKNN